MGNSSSKEKKFKRTSSIQSSSAAGSSNVTPGGPSGGLNSSATGAATVGTSSNSFDTPASFSGSANGTGRSNSGEAGKLSITGRDRPLLDLSLTVLAPCSNQLEQDRMAQVVQLGVRPCLLAVRVGPTSLLLPMWTSYPQLKRSWPTRFKLPPVNPLHSYLQSRPSRQVRLEQQAQPQRAPHPQTPRERP